MWVIQKVACLYLIFSLHGFCPVRENGLGSWFRCTFHSLARVRRTFDLLAAILALVACVKFEMFRRKMEARQQVMVCSKREELVVREDRPVPLQSTLSLIHGHAQQYPPGEHCRRWHALWCRTDGSGRRDVINFLNWGG